MGSRVRCFWAEPVKKYELSLRRYHSNVNNTSDCPSSGYGYHNISSILGRYDHDELVKMGWPESEYGLVHTSANNVITREDSRWPAKCSCGYEFRPEDSWQCNPDKLYRRSDNGEMHPLRKLPAGGMYHTDWLDSWAINKYDDKVILTVITPGGEWMVDGPSWNGGVKGPGWTRSGTIPDVTARPSIHIPGKYHGWLNNGWLEEC